MSHSSPTPHFPIHGWLGAAILLAGQVALAAGVGWIATWLTPVMWTGLILLVDGLVYRLRGESWLVNRGREFPLLVLVSVAVWLLFEAYNLHLRNWQYAGLPEDMLVRDFGYFWSFATIMPGVLEVCGLALAVLERIGWVARAPAVAPSPLDAAARDRGMAASSGRIPSWAWSLAGLAMISIPLALPAKLAAYLFGAVWIGFILLLDPLNQRLGLPSLREQWGRGMRSTTYALLLGGLACGLLWEAWNQQAAAAGGAYWIYTFPSALRPLDLRYGQMPLLGLLGFPPFALELYAFYQFLRELLGGQRLLGPPPDLS